MDKTTIDSDKLEHSKDYNPEPIYVPYMVVIPKYIKVYDGTGRHHYEPISEFRKDDLSNKR